MGLRITADGLEESVGHARDPIAPEPRRKFALEEQAKIVELPATQASSPGCISARSHKQQEPSMTKIALITGASRGLGRNTALSIARRGRRRHHHLPEPCRRTLEPLSPRSRRWAARRSPSSSTPAMSLPSRRSPSACGRRCGRPGSATPSITSSTTPATATWPRSRETTEAQFDQLVNVHFKGVFFLTQALLPLIADGGRIVNLSTGLTRVSFPGYAAYAAVKGAVEVLTRLPGEGTRRARHRGQHRGAGRDRDRLRRRRGPRQSPISTRSSPA